MKGLDSTTCFHGIHCQTGNSCFINLGNMVKQLLFSLYRNSGPPMSKFYHRSRVKALRRFSILKLIKKSQTYLSINYDNRFWFEVGFGNIYGGLC